MARRFTVTVDRDAIDHGDLSAPVRVRDNYTGNTTNYGSADLYGARIVSGGPGHIDLPADGARVWIEADSVIGYG